MQWEPQKPYILRGFVHRALPNPRILLGFLHWEPQKQRILQGFVHRASQKPRILQGSVHGKVGFTLTSFRKSEFLVDSPDIAMQ